MDIFESDPEAINVTEEAELWRDVARQLAAALRMARQHIGSGHDALILPHDHPDLTAGHVVDGALAMFEHARRNIAPPF